MTHVKVKSTVWAVLPASAFQSTTFVLTIMALALYCSAHRRDKWLKERGGLWNIWDSSKEECKWILTEGGSEMEDRLRWGELCEATLNCWPERNTGRLLVDWCVTELKYRKLWGNIGLNVAFLSFRNFSFFFFPILFLTWFHGELKLQGLTEKMFFLLFTNNHNKLHYKD